MMILRVGAVLTLLAFGGACGDEGAKNKPTDKGNSDAQTLQWEIIDDVPEYQSPTFDQLSAGEKVALDLIGTDEYQNDYLLRPVVSDSQDLLELVAPDTAQLLFIDNLLRILQTVPGVPEDPRFSDPKFDSVKEAFSSECKESAAQIGTATLSLLAIDQSAFMEELQNALPKSDVYESSCLVQLAEVPAAVRQVIGVLTWEKRTFCSATVVGKNKILTSRHCFFDADKGKSRPEWQALQQELIIFRTPVPHGVESAWYAMPDKSVDKTEAAFKPFADHILLDVPGADFTRTAVIRTKLNDHELPIMAWVVGSNSILGDVKDLKNPFEYVRGSLDKTCAVMEVTSNGCLYHTCQTGGSTSGAGVLKIDENNDVTLVGVHKGPAARSTGCEASPPIRLAINLAAQYTTPEVRDKDE